MTGHADGSVRFWDTTGTAMQQLHRLRTQKLFEKNKVKPLLFVISFTLHWKYGRPVVVRRLKRTRTQSRTSPSARIVGPWQWRARPPKYFFIGATTLLVLQVFDLVIPDSARKTANPRSPVLRSQ